MSWRYAVTYRKDGKMHDRLFDTEEQARTFFFKRKVYGDDAILFRVDKRSFLENLLDGHILWLGFKIPIYWLLTSTVVVAATYFLLESK